MFRECPVCKLPVQPGKNGDGLAWHDCAFVLGGAGRTEHTVEAIREEALRRLRESTTKASPRELVAILGALEKLSPAVEPAASEETGTSSDLVSWLNAEAPRPRAVM